MARLWQTTNGKQRITCAYCQPKEERGNAVSSEDVDAAEDFRFGCQLATLRPVISATVGQAGSGDIAELLQGLQTQLGGIQTQLRGMKAQLENLQQGQQRMEDRLDIIATRQDNAFAVFDDDAIVPPTLGGIDPPDNFPRTVLALRNLKVGANLTEVENYYGIGDHGTFSRRIKRVAKVYGVNIMLQA